MDHVTIALNFSSLMEEICPQMSCPGVAGCHMRFLEQNFLGCGLQESSSINARNLFFTVRSIKGNAGIREPGFSTEDAHRVHLDTLTLQVASGPLDLLSHFIPMGLLIKT